MNHDDVGAASAKQYLIRKGGYYYRPNAQGYTSDIAQAGRYSLKEAISYSHPNGPDGPRDGITYEAAPPVQASMLGDVASLVAALREDNKFSNQSSQPKPRGTLRTERHKAAALIKFLQREVERLRPVSGDPHLAAELRSIASKCGCTSDAMHLEMAAQTIERGGIEHPNDFGLSVEIDRLTEELTAAQRVKDEAVQLLAVTAAKPTIEEMMAPDFKDPWAGLSIEERIEAIGRRKLEADGEILSARAFLAKHSGE